MSESSNPVAQADASVFRQWSRSTAFNVALRERGITDLLDMYGEALNSETSGHTQPGLWFRGRIGDASYLERRGLANRHPDEGDRLLITKAGRLVAELLVLSGFTSSRYEQYLERAKERERDRWLHIP